MAVTLKTRQQRRFGPPREDLIYVRDVVARMTAGHDGGSLRIDFAKLNENERDKLLSLTNEMTEGPGTSIERLGKRDRSAWEKLVEKACGREGCFAKLREQATFRAEMAKIEQSVRKPPRRVRYEQEGSIRLPRKLFEQFDRKGKNPAVAVPTAGMLVLVLACLENGVALSPNSRLEGDGDDTTLVIDKRLGLGERFGPPMDWPRRLDRLAKLGWLRVEHRRQLVYVGRGPLVLKTIKGES